MARFRTTCRVIAGFYLVIVLFAVLWDSGAQIAMLKESLGPWFLDAVGKDIVLNLVMLAPLTFLAHLGWPRVAWWQWALAGCAVGAGAELAQWALPFLTRRPAWANVAENAVGAWSGALAAHALWRLRRRLLVRAQSPRPRPGLGGRTGIIRRPRPERPECGAA